MSERVKIKIQGKVYELEGKVSDADITEKKIILDKPMKIDIKIGENVKDLECEVIEVVYCYLTPDCRRVKTKDGLEIGFFSKTGVVKYIYFHNGGRDIYVETISRQPVKVTGFKNIDKYGDYLPSYTEILFFSDRTLKAAKIREDVNLNIEFYGRNYDLPFKNGDEIIFNDNRQLSQKCIDESSERSNIVCAKRLDDLEKSQEKTKQEVKKLQTNQKIATWGDWLFVLITCGIGFDFIFSALGFCFGKRIWPFNWITPENFDKMCFNYGFSFLNPEHETFNKYTFFFEILKRAPIIILIILGFKFLQLAFERIRLVGEVERVQKYIKLTNDDTTKNKLLKIIALPFFTKKKMKSSVKFLDDFRSVILEKEENKG